MTGCLRQVNYKQPVAQEDYVLMNNVFSPPVSVIIYSVIIVSIIIVNLDAQFIQKHNSACNKNISLPLRNIISILKSTT